MDAHDSYRIGHAAQLLGVTTRSLRHYDRLGLVTPSERTVGGARRYTNADLDRLRLVIAFAVVGAPLAEIPPLLALLERAERHSTLGPQDIERLGTFRADLRQRIEMFRRRANTVEHLNDLLTNLP